MNLDMVSSSENYDNGFKPKLPSEIMNMVNADKEDEEWSTCDEEDEAMNCS
jgi:hypothetical protein